MIVRFQVGEHDDLIMMRPTGLAPGQYQPLVQALSGSLGSWKRENYKRRCWFLPFLTTTPCWTCVVYTG